MRRDLVARSRDASAPTLSTAMAIHKAYTVIFFTRAGEYRVGRTSRPRYLFSYRPKYYRSQCLVGGAEIDGPDIDRPKRMGGN